MSQVLLLEAPEDPEAHKQWAKQMARVQYAMWVNDGALCAQCRKPYASVDDMIARNPRATGRSWPDMFVDDACWEAYSKVSR